MIEITKGNLLEADAEVLVNTVNTVGVMGKGIALQFKQAYPDNFGAYKRAVDRGEVVPGRMFVYATNQLVNPKYIVNFPTKQHWKGNSRLEYITDGLHDLLRWIKQKGVKSIAMPPLGCGNGGLQWTAVRPIIEEAFRQTPGVQVYLYAPVGAPASDQMRVATKRPNMTATRAALLMLLQDYMLPGYHLSLIEVQKLSYFLQASGQPMRLEFVRGQYGPYAEKLNHVLQRMEGHHIRGYGDRSSEASIVPLPDAIEEAAVYLAGHPEAKDRLKRVADLIEGFETPLGLELLGTVHWLSTENEAVRQSVEESVNGVHVWSQRKSVQFRPDHVKAAWQRLKEQEWI